MDLQRIIDKAGRAKASTAFRDLLARFLEPAFGALPKGEIELLVLDALVEIGAISANPQIYELVSKLKVTRSKARKLIYERELRKKTEAELDASVKELLRHPVIQKSGEQFALEIENPLVSDHLRAQVQRLGHVSDGSFSPSIVKLPIGAVSSLIESYLTKEEQKDVTQALIKAGAPDPSFRGALRAMSQRLATKIASDTGAAVADNAAEYMGPLMDAATEQLTARATDLFKEDGNVSG